MTSNELVGKMTCNEGKLLHKFLNQQGIKKLRYTTITPPDYFNVGGRNNFFFFEQDHNYVVVFIDEDFIDVKIFNKKKKLCKMKTVFSGDCLRKFYAKELKKDYLWFCRRKYDQLLSFAIQGGMQCYLEDELKEAEENYKFVERLVS